MNVKITGFVVLVLVLLSSLAQAEYAEECRMLADRLASEPGTLKVAELDLLKNCLSGLQRGIILGEPAPAPSPAKVPPVPECPAAEVVEKIVEKETQCPPCTAAACPNPAPKREVEPVRERPREREKSGSDRRLKPYLPQF